MKNIINKNEKGITLIALVITIIVLLILAGVAISMLSGENGIINKTNSAKTDTETAKQEEEEKLLGYETVIDDSLGNEKKDLIEEEKIRALYEKVMIGDTAAQSELQKIQKSACTFMKKDVYTEGVVIIEGEKGIYEYFIDITNLKVTVLSKSYAYYSEVMKLKNDFYATRKVFIGKDIGDFEQERIDETHWKLKNLPNDMYVSEIEIYYYEGNSYIMITYDDTLSHRKFTLESNSLSIVDDKITGVITNVGQDD